MTDQTEYIHYITFQKVKYIKLEDVALILQKIADAEETDVRNRINHVIANLLRNK